VSRLSAAPGHRLPVRRSREFRNFRESVQGTNFAWIPHHLKVFRRVIGDVRFTLGGTTCISSRISRARSGFGAETFTTSVPAPPNGSFGESNPIEHVDQLVELLGQSAGQGRTGSPSTTNGQPGHSLAFGRPNARLSMLKRALGKRPEIRLRAP